MKKFRESCRCGETPVNVTIEELDYIFKVNSIKMLFDGIDEIVNVFPDIISALATIKRIYKNCNIITTSRMSGDYISSIPFFEISLLPFTEEQRNKFIRDWFAGNSKLQNELIHHLKTNEHIAQVIQNPLLATILCVNAENNLPFPDSEVKLYKQRFELLLGRYDYFKKISSRIHFQSDELLDISHRLAFLLHSEKERHASKEQLITLISQSYKDKYSIDSLSQAISDLVDPCNILVPMTEDGRFGFGHLRYQEYLSACELVKNRSIVVGKYLAIDWWRDVLVFFSQLTPDISFLIDWLCSWGDFKSSAETFMAMISVRPKQEQSRLVDEFKKYCRSYDIRLD